MTTINVMMLTTMIIMMTMTRLMMLVISLSASHQCDDRKRESLTMTGAQLHLNALHYYCITIASQLLIVPQLHHNCITIAHCATIHCNEQSLELTAHAPHQLANQPRRCINKSPQPVFRGLFPPLSPIFWVE